MPHALCVGRHRFLSEHIATVFRDFGLDTTPAVGLEGALAASAEQAFDVVLCDYDVLSVAPIEGWELDARLAQVPVVAVSLTRRPEEVHALDANGIACFLYLPVLDRETALRALAHCRPLSAPAYSLPGPFAPRARQTA